MDVRTYLRAIRKSWWLLVVAVLLGGAAGYVYSARSPKVYAASVTFYVVTPPSSSSNNAQSSDLLSQSRAANYALLVSSGRTASAVRRQDSSIGLPASIIATEIVGSSQLDTNLITASIADRSRARALKIAKALAQAFPAVVSDVEATNGKIAVYLRVISYPAVGAAPVLPRTNLNVLLGVAAGLVLGLLLAVLRFLRDTSVRTREDAEAITHAPLIGDIGYDSAARDAPLVLERQARSIRAEAFRQLRTNIQFVDAAGRLRVILVTSSAESEGKSTTATNLALMFAETGRSVLLIGADLRRPRVGQYLGLDSSIGLTNVLVHQVRLDEALQPWGVDGMTVLASGSVPPNPSELLGSPAMAEVLERLRRRYDMIIIDTPPLLPVTDAAVLATHADGVVLVCRHGKTHRAQLASAVRALESVNARIVGVVLNMRPARGPDSEQYGGYGYYSDTPQGRLAPLRARLRPLGRVLFWRRPSAARAPEPAAVDWTPMPLPGPMSYEDAIGPRPEDSAVAAGDIPDSALSAYRRRLDRPRRGRRRSIPVEPAVPAAGLAPTPVFADDASGTNDDAVGMSDYAGELTDDAVDKNGSDDALTLEDDLLGEAEDESDDDTDATAEDASDTADGPAEDESGAPGIHDDDIPDRSTDPTSRDRALSRR